VSCIGFIEKKCELIVESLRILEKSQIFLNLNNFSTLFRYRNNIFSSWRICPLLQMVTGRLGWRRWPLLFDSIH